MLRMLKTESVGSAPCRLMGYSFKSSRRHAQDDRVLIHDVPKDVPSSPNDQYSWSLYKIWLYSRSCTVSSSATPG